MFPETLVRGSRSRKYRRYSQAGEGVERYEIELLGVQASHEKFGVGKVHARIHGCAFDLLKIVVLKGEAVHGEDQLG